MHLEWAFEKQQAREAATVGVSVKMKQREAIVPLFINADSLKKTQRKPKSINRQGPGLNYQLIIFSKITMKMFPPAPNTLAFFFFFNSSTA